MCRMQAYRNVLFQYFIVPQLCQFRGDVILDRLLVVGLQSLPLRKCKLRWRWIIVVLDRLLIVSLQLLPLVEGECEIRLVLVHLLV